MTVPFWMIPITMSVCSSITTVVTLQLLTLWRQWRYCVIGIKVACLSCYMYVDSADGGVHVAEKGIGVQIHPPLGSSDTRLDLNTVLSVVPSVGPLNIPVLSRLVRCGKLLALVTVGVPLWCSGKGQIPSRNNRAMSGVGTRMATVCNHVWCQTGVLAGHSGCSIVVQWKGEDS
jgi:hypothetical protein